MIPTAWPFREGNVYLLEMESDGATLYVHECNLKPADTDPA